MTPTATDGRPGAIGTTTGQPRAERLLTWLSAPVDGAGLGAVRVLVGLVGLWQTIRFVANGWVETQWLEPAFHFTWAGFDWVRPLPGAGMYALLAVQGLAAVALTLGWRTRIAAAVFALAFTYGDLVDKALYLNHHYLLSLLALLFVFVPVGAALSLDARRRGERQVPQASYVLLRLQVATVYVYAGLAKLHPDWLVHGEPLRIWLQAHHDLPVLGPLLDTEAAAIFMGWAGMLHDLFIVPLLLWRRTRAVALIAVVAFHLTIWALFPVGVFSFVMLAAVTVCLAPDWPRRWLARAARRSRTRGTTGRPRPTNAPDRVRPLGRLALGLGAAWIVLQVALPLRHLAYPGPVNWTEEGFRFAWRVMLIDKTGHVEFRVQPSPDARPRVVRPDDLTPLQRRMMSTQPDMIQDYAHHLAARWRARGYPEVAVRADAWVSLNGHPSRRIIDPDADLAAAPRSLAPKPWILP